MCKSALTNKKVLFVGTSVFLTALTIAATPAYSAPVDYAKLKNDILAAIAAEDDRRGDGTSIGPTLIRLAWHAAGTYSIFDKTGGSEGATMRFSPECNWGANAGNINDISDGTDLIADLFVFFTCFFSE